jgi:hypothetical protein
MATTTTLPSPSFSDSTALTATINRMRAIDGTLYTYVHSKNNRKRFVWQFNLAKHKAIELREFLDSYFSNQIQITDHLGAIHVGFVRNNPFEFIGEGVAVDWPGNESVSITIEFEEK